MRNGSKELVFLPTAFVDDLLAVVITPLRETQALFSEYGTLTRLYTTLSASEMTRDPVFDFNPDLPQVSNLRTAAARWECEVDDPDSVALEQFLLVVTLKDGREIRSRPFEDLGEPHPLPLGVQAAAVIEQMDTAGEPVPIRQLTAVTQNVEGALPASYDLEAAYPNPFNAAVLLPFRVPQGLTTADLGVTWHAGMVEMNGVWRSLVASTSCAWRHLVWRFHANCSTCNNSRRILPVQVLQ